MVLESGIPNRFLPGVSGKDVVLSHRESNKLFHGYYSELQLALTNTFSLYFHGVSGSGRSETAAILGKKALSFGFSVCYVQAIQFLDVTSILVPSAYESASRWACEADLLILDDSHSLRFLPDALGLILENRRNNGKSTIIVGMSVFRSTEGLSVHEQSLLSFEDSLLRMEKGLGIQWTERITTGFDHIFTGACPHRCGKHSPFETNSKGGTVDDEG